MFQRLLQLLMRVAHMSACLQPRYDIRGGYDCGRGLGSVYIYHTLKHTHTLTTHVQQLLNVERSSCCVEQFIRQCYR